MVTLRNFRQAKNRKQGFFSSQTPRTLGQEGKNAQENKEFLAGKKTRTSDKNKERKDKEEYCLSRAPGVLFKPPPKIDFKSSETAVFLSGSNATPLVSRYENRAAPLKCLKKGPVAPVGHEGQTHPKKPPTQIKTICTNSLCKQFRDSLYKLSPLSL